MIRLRMGLQAKFIFLTSLLILVTALTLSQLFVSHLERKEVENLETLGLTIARNLAHNAELGVLTRNREMLEELGLGPLQGRDVAYLEIVDQEGRGLARLDSVEGLLVQDDGGENVRVPPQGDVRPVQIQLGEESAFAGVEARFPVSTTRPPETGEDVGFFLEEDQDSWIRERIGWVKVGLSLLSSEAEIARLRGAFGMLTFLVVALAVLLTVLIVQVILRPVEHMALATRRIAQGQLDETIDIRSQDEIGELGRSFNKMTENLRVSREALEHYSAELEEKVKQRSTELDQAQSQLVQAEKMSAMGELVSGVAHELNNPLAGVIGYSQLLLGAPVQEKVRRGLDRINREAERCKRIVQNLQVFARKHKPQKNYVGINGILTSTLDLRSYQMQVDNVMVITRLQPDLPKTMADFHQLQQVFMNLLVNAHQAIRSAERRGKIEVETGELNGRIVIRMSDNGGGIAPEVLNKIFDPFFTTKEVGQGTGLGLSICYGIVLEHRGRIFATSSVGEGTTFTVELPILQPSSVEVEMWTSEEQAAKPVAQTTAASTRRGNILIIDDEESIIDVLHETLQMDGHRVDTARNGNAALSKIRKERYDVIISDLKMPGMGGEELYRTVKEIAPQLASRIVFSTGDVASIDTRTFLERCGNPYLQKPFELSAIRRIVLDVLDQRPH